MREDKSIFFMEFGDLIEEIDFLLGHPLLEEFSKFLLFGTKDVLIHFVMDNS
jgi:hypothetical protein